MRQVIQTLALLFAIVLLAGCETIKYVDKPVPYLREPLGIKPPEPLVLENVSVILVKPEGKPAYFKLDPASYKGLLLNNKQIEGYIREANSRIEACEAYYTAPIEGDQAKQK